MPEYSVAGALCEDVSWHHRQLKIIPQECHLKDWDIFHVALEVTIKGRQRPLPDTAAVAPKAADITGVTVGMYNMPMNWQRYRSSQKASPATGKGKGKMVPKPPGARRHHVALGGQSASVPIRPGKSCDNGPWRPASKIPLHSAGQNNNGLPQAPADLVKGLKS